MIVQNAIKAVFEGSLRLKSTESCLIVTDTIKEPIGRAFLELARKTSQKADIVVIEPTKEHATEPPPDVAKKMLEYDVEILVTDKSLTHTKARKAANSRGARIATMPGINEDICNRCLDIDYEALKKDSNRIYDILKASSSIRITTKLGMDMTFTVGKSDFFGRNGGSFHSPGDYGNLPEGEVSFAPETAEGVFVVDASFPGLGLLNSPITFKTRGGIVHEITGERSAEVKARLDRVGPKAYKVAELGIGLNPKAKIVGLILEDEKVVGTVHVALGNNISYGRDNDVPIHLDGVIKNPDIYVDGKSIMESGKFLLA